MLITKQKTPINFDTNFLVLQYRNTSGTGAVEVQRICHSRYETLLFMCETAQQVIIENLDEYNIIADFHKVVSPGPKIENYCHLDYGSLVSKLDFPIKKLLHGNVNLDVSFSLKIKIENIQDAHEKLKLTLKTLNYESQQHELSSHSKVA